MADRSEHGFGSTERDAIFLRRSFEVARHAKQSGNHPFGALLVDSSGNVLLEAENGYLPSHDGTAHAERLLATRACTTLDADTLRGGAREVAEDLGKRWRFFPAYTRRNLAHY